MSSHISRKAWPVVIIGFIVLTMLVRYSGARRHRARYESENSDGA